MHGDARAHLYGRHHLKWGPRRILSKCQKGYEQSVADVIGYLHADLTIHEKGWDERVLREFEWPTVAVVGFVGGTRLGHDDIYRSALPPSTAGAERRMEQPDRRRGARQTRQWLTPVAVLDSCAVFVRRSFLKRIGGWPLRDAAQHVPLHRPVDMRHRPQVGTPGAHVRRERYACLRRQGCGGQQVAGGEGWR